MMTKLSFGCNIPLNVGGDKKAEFIVQHLAAKWDLDQRAEGVGKSLR